jgi:hypothetical protein
MLPISITFCLATTISLIVYAKTMVKKDRFSVGVSAIVFTITVVVSIFVWFLRFQLRQWAFDTDGNNNDFFNGSIILWAASIVLGAMLGEIYAFSLIKVQSQWKFLFTIPLFLIAIGSSVYVLYDSTELITRFRNKQRENVGFSGTVESLSINDIWCPRGIGIHTRYLDLINDNVHANIVAQKIKVFGGSGFTIGGVNLDNASIVVQSPDSGGPVEITLNKVDQLPKLWEVSNSEKAVEYSFDGVSLSAPPDVMTGVGYKGENKETILTDAHALLLFPIYVSGDFSTGGIKGNNDFASASNPGNLPNLDFTYGDTPIWGFGSKWSSLNEMEARALLLKNDKSIYVSTSPFFSDFYKNRLNSDWDYGGAVNFLFNTPQSAFLVLTESYLRDNANKEAEGTFIFLLEGISKFEIHPSLVARNADFLNSGADWSILLEGFTQDHECLVKDIEAGNIDGNLTRGTDIMQIPKPINTLFIQGRVIDSLNLSFLDRNIYVKAYSSGWHDAYLNGITLWPSWWQDISIDTRASILQGLIIFALGTWFTKQSTILSGFRWLIYGPRESNRGKLELLLMNGDRISASSWDFLKDKNLGSKVCIVKKGFYKNKWDLACLNLVIPLSTIVSMELKEEESAGKQPPQKNNKA